MKCVAFCESATWFYNTADIQEAKLSLG